MKIPFLLLLIFFYLKGIGQNIILKNDQFSINSFVSQKAKNNEGEYKISNYYFKHLGTQYLVVCIILKDSSFGYKFQNVDTFSTMPHNMYSLEDICVKYVLEDYYRSIVSFERNMEYSSGVLPIIFDAKLIFSDGNKHYTTHNSTYLFFYQIHDYIQFSEFQSNLSIINTKAKCVKRSLVVHEGKSTKVMKVPNNLEMYTIDRMFLEKVEGNKFHYFVELRNFNYEFDYFANKGIISIEFHKRFKQSVPKKH